MDNLFVYEANVDEETGKTYFPGKCIARNVSHEDAEKIMEQLYAPDKYWYISEKSPEEI